MNVSVIGLKVSLDFQTKLNQDLKRRHEEELRLVNLQNKELVKQLKQKECQIEEGRTKGLQELSDTSSATADKPEAGLLKDVLKQVETASQQNVETEKGRSISQPRYQVQRLQKEKGTGLNQQSDIMQAKLESQAQMYLGLIGRLEGERDVLVSSLLSLKEELMLMSDGHISPTGILFSTTIFSRFPSDSTMYTIHTICTNLTIFRVLIVWIFRYDFVTAMTWLEFVRENCCSRK